MFYILDENKEPIQVDVDVWCRWSEDIDNRRVAITGPEYGRRVSTIFLGTDHGFCGGKPILFESMLFDGSFEDKDSDRYCTYEEAVAGHDLMVENHSVKSE